MFLLKNIKFFLNDLDISIAKSFFYFQCSFRYVVKDFFKTKFSLFKFSNNFEIKKGSIKIEKFNENYSENFVKRTLYSQYITKDDLDYNLKKIIDENYNHITSYLGKNFLHDKTIIYRNFNFLEEFNDYDVYSNIWHQDTHDGKRLLRIFLLIENVDEKNGPLVILNREQTKKYWKLLKDRYTQHNQNSRIDFENQIAFTGKKGDYLIADTSNCMHRAGIPENTRDMMQVTLYPNWMKKEGRKVY